MVRPPRDPLADLLADEIAGSTGSGVDGRRHDAVPASSGRLEDAITRSLGDRGRDDSRVRRAMTLPTRTLGRTGQRVTIFGLGGEGVLRTHGREREARIVIETALEAGVNYFDTAPAYDGSQDYLGRTLRASGVPRNQLFLASKANDRTYDGAMRQLEATLLRLGTDYLDLWQVHDLQRPDQLAAVFNHDGVIQAIEEARRSGVARHVGLTGHYDPAILLHAMRAYNFDTVLMPLNVGDRHHLSFSTTVLPEARRQGMGVIAMKIAAKGYLPANGFSMRDLFNYALSQDGVALAIIGCSSQREVEENVALARGFSRLLLGQQQALEARAGNPVHVAGANHFKRGYAP